MEQPGPPPPPPAPPQPASSAASSSAAAAVRQVQFPGGRAAVTIPNSPQEEDVTPPNGREWAEALVTRFTGRSEAEGGGCSISNDTVLDCWICKETSVEYWNRQKKVWLRDFCGVLYGDQPEWELLGSLMSHKAITFVRGSRVSVQSEISTWIINSVKRDHTHRSKLRDLLKSDDDSKRKTGWATVAGMMRQCCNKSLFRETYVLQGWVAGESEAMKLLCGMIEGEEVACTMAAAYLTMFFQPKTVDKGKAMCSADVMRKKFLELGALERAAVVLGQQQEAANKELQYYASRLLFNLLWLYDAKEHDKSEYNVMVRQKVSDFGADRLFEPHLRCALESSDWRVRVFTLRVVHSMVRDDGLWPGVSADRKEQVLFHVMDACNEDLGDGDSDIEMYSLRVRVEGIILLPSLLRPGDEAVPEVLRIVQEWMECNPVQKGELFKVRPVQTRVVCGLVSLLMMTKYILENDDYKTSWWRYLKLALTVRCYGPSLIMSLQEDGEHELCHCVSELVRRSHISWKILELKQPNVNLVKKDLMKVLVVTSVAKWSQRCKGMLKGGAWVTRGQSPGTPTRVGGDEPDKELWQTLKPVLCPEDTSEKDKAERKICLMNLREALTQEHGVNKEELGLLAILGWEPGSNVTEAPGSEEPEKDLLCWALEKAMSRTEGGGVSLEDTVKSLVFSTIKSARNMLVQSVENVKADDVLLELGVGTGSALHTWCFYQLARKGVEVELEKCKATLQQAVENPLGLLDCSLEIGEGGDSTIGWEVSTSESSTNVLDRQAKKVRAFASNDPTWTVATLRMCTEKANMDGLLLYMRDSDSNQLLPTVNQIEVFPEEREKCTTPVEVGRMQWSIDAFRLKCFQEAGRYSVSLLAKSMRVGKGDKAEAELWVFPWVEAVSRESENLRPTRIGLQTMDLVGLHGLNKYSQLVLASVGGWHKTIKLEKDKEASVGDTTRVHWTWPDGHDKFVLKATFGGMHYTVLSKQEVGANAESEWNGILIERPFQEQGGVRGAAMSSRGGQDVETSSVVVDALSQDSGYVYPKKVDTGEYQSLDEEIEFVSCQPLVHALMLGIQLARCVDWLHRSERSLGTLTERAFAVRCRDGHVVFKREDISKAVSGSEESKVNDVEFVCRTVNSLSGRSGDKRLALSAFVTGIETQGTAGQVLALLKDVDRSTWLASLPVGQSQRCIAALPKEWVQLYKENAAMINSENTWPEPEADIKLQLLDEPQKIVVNSYAPSFFAIQTMLARLIQAGRPVKDTGLFKVQLLSLAVNCNAALLLAFSRKISEQGQHRTELGWRFAHDHTWDEQQLIPSGTRVLLDRPPGFMREGLHSTVLVRTLEMQRETGLSETVCGMPAFRISFEVDARADRPSESKHAVFQYDPQGNANEFYDFWGMPRRQLRLLKELAVAFEGEQTSREMEQANVLDEEGAKSWIEFWDHAGDTGRFVPHAESCVGDGTEWMLLESFTRNMDGLPVRNGELLNTDLVISKILGGELENTVENQFKYQRDRLTKKIKQKVEDAALKENSSIWADTEKLEVACKRMANQGLGAVHLWTENALYASITWALRLRKYPKREEDAGYEQVQAIEPFLSLMYRTLILLSEDGDDYNSNLHNHWRGEQAVTAHVRAESIGGAKYVMGPLSFTSDFEVAVQDFQGDKEQTGGARYMLQIDAGDYTVNGGAAGRHQFRAFDICTLSNAPEKEVLLMGVLKLQVDCKTYDASKEGITGAIHGSDSLDVIIHKRTIGSNVLTSYTLKGLALTKARIVSN